MYFSYVKVDHITFPIGLRRAYLQSVFLMAKIKIHIACCIVLIMAMSLLGTANGQVISYMKEMLALSTSINKHFYKPGINYFTETAKPEKKGKKVSYLWPLCAMFEAGNEMGKLTGNFTEFENIFSIIKKYHSHFLPAPAYASYSGEFGGGTRFYDDNQWIGITAMDAYAQNKSHKWLAVGEEIYKFMMTGFDTVSGGGLYWEEGNHKTKNTCSNGPGIILALQLYKATNKKSYLDTALLLYNWVNKNLRSNETLFFDNIILKKPAIDKRIYSYNSGTMLQSNIYLFEATGDKKFLQEAIAIAKSSAGYFFSEGRFKDNFWFNAVLLRGYQHLLKYEKRLDYILAFRKALDNALLLDKNETGLMGVKKEHNLVGQGGMLEILARFAWLQQNKIII